METRIMKVVQCGEVVAVPSQKAEGGQVLKRTVVLQELGGKYEDCYAATLMGTAAETTFAEGDMVAARLHFTTHEYNDNVYQSITVKEMVRIKK